MAENAEKLQLVKGRRYTPNSFGPSSWWRFDQDRRRRYLSILPDPPDERQLLALRMLIENEWDALVAAHNAEIATSGRDRYYAQRLAVDCRKQALLWTRELVAAIAAANKSEPTAPQPSLDVFLADIAARHAQSGDTEPSEDEDDAA